MKVCAEPGCPTLIASGTYKNRCPKHRPNNDRNSHGYGATHRRLRNQYQRRLNAGEHLTCWRCHTPINPSGWVLGHCDDDRSITHGPECPPCNQATAGRTHCPHPSHL